MSSLFQTSPVTRQRLIGLFLVMLVCALLSQSAHVPEARAISVDAPQSHAFEVYTNPNWSGELCYSDTPMTANVYVTCNDQISSIILQAGWSARVYRDLNETGPSVCVNRTQSDLTLGTFDDGSPSNDAISSFILYNQPWCGGSPVATWPLEVYNDPNYSGTRCYSWDVLSADINALCNDQISSVLLRLGWSVRFYRDPQESGPSQCINTSDPDLTDNTFDDGSPMNDAISSHTVYHQPNCSVSSIAGQVTDNNSAALSGVTISDGAGHTATTDANGKFALSGLSIGSYTLTPSKSSYTFNPTNRAVSVPPDATGQNFVGTPLPVPSDVIVVESRNLEYSPSIGGTCATGWYVSSYGGQGHGVLTLNASNASQSKNSAIWRPNMPRAGWYKVEAFVPYHPFFQWPCVDYRITSDTSHATYEIHLTTGTTTKVVNQAPLNDAWVDLGAYYFGVGTAGYVRLSDMTGEPFASRMVSFDDMRFTYIGNDCQPTAISSRLGGYQISAPNGGACNQPTGSLGGTITNAQNGAKVSAATVTLGGGPGINYVVQTGANGNYQRDFIIAGTYTIRVERDGYQPFVSTVQVPMNASKWFNIALTPNRTSGTYYFPIRRSPAEVGINTWYDTYFDQVDRDRGQISEYQGIEGYNSDPVGYSGPGWCWKDSSWYFYSGKAGQYGGFSYDYNCNWQPGLSYNRHDGIDYNIANGSNIDILAAATGHVWRVGSDEVVLWHDDKSFTIYSHVIPNVETSQPVAKGQKIATSGNSQNHFHFGIKLNAYGNVDRLYDGNPNNYSPAVDPYTFHLWASDSGVGALSNVSGNVSVPKGVSNQLPLPLLTVTPAYAVGENAQIAFDASSAHDPDGAIIDYIWDFGDGTSGNGVTTTHVYSIPGTYYVSLGVFDNTGDVAYSDLRPIIIHNDYLTTKVDGTQNVNDLSDGQTITRSIKISDTLRATFQFTWTNGTVEPTLVDPAGTVITPGTPMANVIYMATVYYASYQIEKPLPGTYGLRLTGSNISSTAWVTSSVAVLDVHPPVVTKADMKTAPASGGTGITLTLDMADTESLAGMLVRYSVDHGDWSSWQVFTPKVSFTVPVTYVESTAIQLQDGSGNLSLLYGTGTLIYALPPRSIFLPLILR
jgi:murein DD-endopeptidase MepM/ murein hydrolase activator NlpD